MCCAAAAIDVSLATMLNTGNATLTTVATQTFASALTYASSENGGVSAAQAIALAIASATPTDVTRYDCECGTFDCSNATWGPSCAAVAAVCATLHALCLKQLFCSNAVSPYWLVPAGIVTMVLANKQLELVVACYLQLTVMLSVFDCH